MNRLFQFLLPLMLCLICGIRPVSAAEKMACDHSSGDYANGYRSCSNINESEPVVIEVNSWAELREAFDNANGGDIIKLSGDVVATEEDFSIYVPSGPVTLDLNGYTINRNLTSATGNGNVFWSLNADFTIIDSSEEKTGTITGGYNEDSSGAISFWKGTLKILGGTITGNKTLAYGGGITINCKDGTLIVGGTAKVINNTAKEEGDAEVTSNIHLHNNEVENFRVGTGEEALVPGIAEIGIRFWTGDPVNYPIPDAVCDIPNAAIASCFEADNTEYDVFAENKSGSYKLVVKVCTHDFNGGTSCQATCIYCGKRNESGTHTFNSKECSATCSACGAYKTESEHSFDDNDICTVCGIKKVTKISDGVYVDNQGLRYSLYNGKMAVEINQEWLSEHTELNVIIPKKIVCGEFAKEVILIPLVGRTFENCTKLKSVELSEGFTTIGATYFFGCTGLTSVKFPSTLTEIEEYAFNKCGSLESITIPDGVKKIDNSCFGRCTSLKSVSLPDGLLSIGVNAFNMCSSLENITIPASVETVNSMYAIFKGCSSEKLVLNIACTPKLRAVPDWGDYKTINWIHDFTAEETKAEALKSAATCLDKAVYYRSCPVCGLVHESDDDVFAEGSALGHSFTNYVSNNDATTEADGTKTAHCDRGCGATDTITDEGSKLSNDPTTACEIIEVESPDVLVFPNPVQSNEEIKIHIENFNEGTFRDAKIMIFGNNGLLVKTLNNIESDNYVSLPTGSYIGTVTFFGGKMSFKIIVR